MFPAVIPTLFISDIGNGGVGDVPDGDLRAAAVGRRIQGVRVDVQRLRVRIAGGLHFIFVRVAARPGVDGHIRCPATAVLGIAFPTSLKCCAAKITGYCNIR